MCARRDAVTTVIDEALALLDAVVTGELLVALPLDTIDRERHSAGVRLVELARDRLRDAELRAVR